MVVFTCAYEFVLHFWAQYKWLALLLLLLLQTDLAQTFSVEPQGLPLLVGDVAMLLCVIHGVPRPSVRWYRYDEEILPSSAPRYQIHSTGAGSEESTSVLEIRSIQATDFGHYKCRAETDGKIKYSGYAQLNQDGERCKFMSNCCVYFMFIYFKFTINTYMSIICMY